MYEAISKNLSGVQLIIVACILHYTGVTARESSKWARQRGVQVGLLACFALSLEGSSESGMSFGEFGSVEFLRLGLLAIIAIGVASLILRGLESTNKTLIARPTARRRQLREQRKNQNESDVRSAEHQRREMVRQAEWEAGRPERERLAREDSERKRVVAEQLQLESERRENARQKLLLCYHQHSPQIQDSISWDRFEEYVGRYLADSVSAMQAEANAERMMEMIASHFEPAETPPEYRTTHDIKAQYDLERAEIGSAGYDERKTAAMIADVNFREDQALAEERR